MLCKLSLNISLALMSVAALAQDPGPDEHAEAWFKSHLAQAQQQLFELEGPRTASTWDLAWVELELSPSLVDASLTGHTRQCLLSLVDGQTVLELDLMDNMIVDDVSPAADWLHENDRLQITLPTAVDSAQQFCVEIDYHGTPMEIGFGSWRLASHAGTPVLSTLSEPSGARTWWPSRDTPADKADSAQVKITVPLEYIPTSNGLLQSVDTLATMHSWTWLERWPIAPYLISIAVTNYMRLDQSYIAMDGSTVMPVHHYVWPEDSADAAIDLFVTVPMLEFFAGLYGEYPFVDEKYGHSEVVLGGAMEHQCNTSYGSGLIRGDNYYDRIVAHELAHQWWGDMITCESWLDIWLNEGFATYSEALWAEHVGGGHQALVTFMNNRCAVSDPSGPIYDPPSTFSSNTVYRKGAWLLHMLRGQLGDSAFFQCLRDWGQSSHKYSTALVADFTQHAAAYTDRDLDGLWQGYLYGMNRPQYEYQWLSRSIAGQEFAEIRLHQIQVEDDFRLDLPLRVTASSLENHWIRDSLRLQSWLLPVDGQALDVVLDPDDWLLESHQSADLGASFRRIVAQVVDADGTPTDLPLRGRLRSNDQSGDWIPGMLQGLFTLEALESGADWALDVSSQLELNYQRPGHADESLVLSLPPLNADWLDLGILQLQRARPWLSIEVLEGAVLLEWSAVSGALDYIVEEAQADLSWQTIAQLPGLSFQQPDTAGVHIYRVRANLEAEAMH